jgi:hypothetical protein
LNIALFLTALPVLCMPVTGSLLRFPDTLLFSFSPETVDARSFHQSDPVIPNIWEDPKFTFEPIPDLPEIDARVTTDLDEAWFGPKPDSLPVSVPIGEPLLTLLQLSNLLQTGEPSDFLFFLTGLSGFTIALLMHNWRPRRRRIPQTPFSSHFPQIIHLTRPYRLP